MSLTEFCLLTISSKTSIFDRCLTDHKYFFPDVKRNTHCLTKYRGVLKPIQISTMEHLDPC